MTSAIAMKNSAGPIHDRGNPGRVTRWVPR
jgi:hypothetical protein